MNILRSGSISNSALTSCVSSTTQIAQRDITIWLAVACVSSLLIYGFLVATQTYYVLVTPRTNETEKKNIIAGFWLTDEARKSRRKNKVTTQTLLAGAAYDPDVLWSRTSRALAKMFFTLFYLGLTVSGTLALTCAAIILGLRTKG
jgi:hypothetical protein